MTEMDPVSPASQESPVRHIVEVVGVVGVDGDVDVDVDESCYWQPVAGSIRGNVPFREISADSQPASFHSRVGSIPSPTLPGSTCFAHLDLTRPPFRDF